ncbi:hypothetical protein J3R30DRAFT_3408059 [Lentinula aciculospora]|uniref:DUF6533 domain-containing protein n=1 Tax=Lentinula aciculospora TaxID=153920 RepID=A0A9W9A0Y9_9AGAR|nr:hypothetical protein J3R30DRAFT_3408059 [Lentinula aciculospora]
MASNISNAIPSTQIPGDTLQAFNDYAAVKYVNAVFLTILIYDHILSIDSETLPWKLPKFLFFMNRYIVPPMLFLLTSQFRWYMCRFVAKFTPWYAQFFIY